MKTCIRCATPKELDAFYKHNKMADGHLNVCKECVKGRVNRRYRNLSTSRQFVESERERGRDKYRRLYREVKPNPEVKRRASSAYRGRFPEKAAARQASSQIPVEEGKSKHHWSYLKEHWRDVIILSVDEHYKIHRFMKYSREHKMYLTNDGELLNSREKHEAYIESILLVVFCLFGGWGNPPLF